MKRIKLLIFVFLFALALGYALHQPAQQEPSKPAPKEELSPMQHAADDVYQSVKSNWNKLIDFVAPRNSDK